MKMLNFIFTVSVIVCFATNSGKAQKSWTLEECIKYALDNNIQIKRQELNTEIRKNNYKQARYDLLPGFSGSASHSASFQNGLNQSTYQYVSNVQQGTANIGGSITLFNGFQNINAIGRNKYNLMAGLADLEKAKNDIALNIAASYLQVLFSLELLDVSKSQLDVTNLQVEKSKRLFEVGNIAKGNLFEIQAQLAREKVAVTNYENQLQLAYLDLTQLLDLDSVGNFRVVRLDSLEAPVANSIVAQENTYNEAVSKLPQIKSAEYSLKTSEKDLDIAKGGRYPTLTLSGGINSRYQLNAKKADNSYYSVFDQLKDFRGTGISIDLNVPIFAKFRNRTNIKNAKIQVLDQQYNLDLQRQILYKDIQKSRTDAIAAFENYNSNQEAVIASEEAFKYTQQKFDVGLVNSIDYNIAKNNLTKAKSDLLQAKYQFIFKIKVLDFYRGVPFTLK